jgi:hypothetical protein
VKLKNKKTGEIKECVVIPIDSNGYPNEDQVFEKGESLAELNEEWEDYEEQKEYYWIDYDGKVKTFLDIYEWQDKMKEIGNYFETKEEAEKAVKKLKAWKRLKDKGFRLEGWTIDDGLRISICTNFDSDGIYDEDRKEAKKDLDICFGGEE